MRKLLLLILLAVPAAFPAAASASLQQVMTFEANRELLGPNADATRDPTLDEIRALGVKRVRILMYWGSIAPDPTSGSKPSFDATDPGAYPAESWGRFDRLMASAKARGIEVHVTLTGPGPRWATKSSRAPYVSNPSPAEFGAFATAAGRRYAGDVAIWSIWNEPNQPQFLMPQFRKGKAASPRLYRRLYQAAQKGLVASGNGGDTILIGETSPRGNQRIVAPLAFLRGTFCLSRSYRKSRRCGRLTTDGYAHHPYSRSTGPRVQESDADDVTMSGIGRLVRALDRAGKARAVRRGLGIYLTEFGTQSAPDPVAVSLAKQAEYNAMSERLAYLNPRVRSFSQYLMSDDDPKTNGEDYGGFESGLRRHDGRVKPAYDAFRTPLVVTDYGRSDVGWGLVRPAEGATTVEIEYRNRGAKKYRTLRTIKTNSRSVFAFKSGSRTGRRYRVRWTAPDGATYVGPPIRAYK
jgi:hypothetical protein